MSKNYDQYIQDEFGSLAGKTVQGVREMTYAETVNMDWNPGCDHGIVIMFTDGTLLVPMRDPEGNGAGFPLVEVPE